MGGKINCILIVIDTLRADHLGCYGYFRDTSPNLDRLAEEGVLFKDFHATAIPTGPGFTSIITGLAPIHHRFYLTPWNLPNLIDFDDSIPTLPELIQDVIGGYTTAAFDNLINFSSHMDQFVRGFEYYINPSRTARPVHHHLLGGEVNERLIPWLRAHADEPFFLFVHYWDPHTPYNQPPEFRDIFKHEPGNLDDLQVKEAPAGYSYVPGWGRVGEIWEPDPKRSKVTIDLYDGEIRYVDSLVGDVVETLKGLGLEERTVLFITSDHGEQLGQHGTYDHRMLHEAVTFVPLIIWGPGRIPQGRVIEGYLQQADIAPTILTLLGAREGDLPPFDGMNLLPLIEGQASPAPALQAGARQEMFIEDHEYRAVVQGRWKYMRNYFQGTEALYNIEDDPMEVINLAGSGREHLEVMRSRLASWVQENLEGEVDPMWAQVARWSASWNATFGTDFPDLMPRPTIVEM